MRRTIVVLVLLVLKVICSSCTVSAAEMVFSDVPADAWYQEYLQAAYDSGIVCGIGNGCFDPDGSLTNAQILVIAAQLHSQQKADEYDFQSNIVDGDHWGRVYLDYCKREGIVDEYFEDKLDDFISRGEMACVFSHVLTESSYRKKQDLHFKDTEGSMYEEEIQKLLDADIISGFPGFMYRPNEPITRAQTTVFISNLLDCISQRGRKGSYRYDLNGFYQIKGDQTRFLMEKPILSMMFYRASAVSSGPVVLTYDASSPVYTSDGVLLGTSIVEDLTDYDYDAWSVIPDDWSGKEHIWLRDSREYGLWIHSIWGNDGSIMMRCLRDKTIGGGFGIYVILDGRPFCVNMQVSPDNVEENSIQAENERLLQL